MTKKADGAAARVMARQHSLITLEQARVAGLSEGMVHERVRAGAWSRFGGGVYGAAGVERTWTQKAVAACLIAGPGAVVSGRSAAVVWELSGFRPGPLHILVPDGRSTRNALARVHRTKDLPMRDVTTRHGLPVTRPARTLFDLTADVPRHVLEEAVDDALCRRLTTLAEVEARLDDLSGPGRSSRNLKLVLAPWEPGPLPANVREMRVLRALLARGVPRPERQHVIRDARGRFVGRADLAWPAARVLLETHSLRWHATPGGLARDEVREARLTGAGWLVLWCEPPDIPFADIDDALRARTAA
jgi:hypothetical protein